jgi:hypothetical protein
MDEDDDENHGLLIAAGERLFKYSQRRQGNLAKADDKGIKFGGYNEAYAHTNTHTRTRTHTRSLSLS